MSDYGGRGRHSRHHKPANRPADVPASSRRSPSPARPRAVLGVVPQRSFPRLQRRQSSYNLAARYNEGNVAPGLYINQGAAPFANQADDDQRSSGSFSPGPPASYTHEAPYARRPDQRRPRDARRYAPQPEPVNDENVDPRLFSASRTRHAPQPQHANDDTFDPRLYAASLDSYLRLTGVRFPRVPDSPAHCARKRAVMDMVVSLHRMLRADGMAERAIMDLFRAAMHEAADEGRAYFA